MQFLALAVFLLYVTDTRSQQKCVDNAEPNDQGGCVCMPGFHGDGTFCCVPQTHQLCMVKGDPILHTMNGDLLPIDLPCVTKMSEIHTMGAYMDETVFVYGAGEYQKKGYLSFDYIRLEYWERYNDIHTKIEILNGDIFINGYKHDKTDPWYSPHFEIEASYNPKTNSFTIMSMGTTRVTFTPPDDKHPNKSTGLCIDAMKDSLLHSMGMCNQRKRGLKRSLINKGFKNLKAGVIEFLIRRMPNRKILGHKDVQKTCRGIKYSRRPCRTKWNSAIQECFVIVAQSTIRLCLAREQINILHAFQQCLKAHCNSGQTNSQPADETDKICKCVTMDSLCKTPQ